MIFHKPAVDHGSMSRGRAAAWRSDVAEPRYGTDMEVVEHGECVGNTGDTYEGPGWYS